MKKNNHTIENSKTATTLLFIRNNILFIILFIVFLMASYFVWIRYKANVSKPSKIIELNQPTIKAKPLQENTILLQKDLNALSNRIVSLEKGIQHPLISPNKLTTVELLRGVLEESIQIDLLKTFLSRIPEPWAQQLLATITPVNQGLNYTKLDQLLVVPHQTTVPPEQLTLWERVKKKIKTLISVRKIDSNGGYKFGQWEDIHKELLNHDISKALAAYAKLPDSDKQDISVWLMAAQNRLTLENAMKQILTELAQGGTQ